MAAKQVTPIIRLDTSKPYSECRGERTPDDPHYRVHFMQGRRVTTKGGAKMVLLPFDSQGVLVPDDGKVEPYQGLNVEGKPVMHHPLYNADMRALAERLTKKASAQPEEAQVEEIEEEEDDEGDKGNSADDVNLVSFLKGEARYTPLQLRAAAKQRYHVNYPNVKELVIGLVLDEKVIPESEVGKDLQRYLAA